jgi:hypothetical protein
VWKAYICIKVEAERLESHDGDVFTSRGAFFAFYDFANMQ